MKNVFTVAELEAAAVLLTGLPASVIRELHITPGGVTVVYESDDESKVLRLTIKHPEPREDVVLDAELVEDTEEVS